MFVFWGDGSAEAKDLVDAILVRSTANFNWTFIFILSVVFYVYWTEVKNKDYMLLNHISGSASQRNPTNS